ncbi:hypothetical protein Pst134EA_025511 [Puccinia striiformis f. sp. tritici]|uniref:hypothetical protein n=1 Tax=Puccinia striiformis f. sp. tritici TaxID=168172 RepID=UPI002008B110|nr:hypothetical protein Pst134EA_025511 [Puccinia striiformis f. sp. tritici]KAH9451564.1 hypothetical protein Pst134EA_025511 [Puccinia striiformis f. sp. tritici]
MMSSWLRDPTFSRAQPNPSNILNLLRRASHCGTGPQSSRPRISSQTRFYRYTLTSTSSPRIQMHLPVQQLVLSPDKTLLVLASSSHLQVIDRLSATRLASTSDLQPHQPGSHSGFIRLLLIHNSVLVSTGEDKALKTWSLPGLKLINSRQLIKRATSIAVSPDGKNIVIADKFGDVYDLPFDAPSQTIFQADPDQEAEERKPSVTGTEEGAMKKTLPPIAGHVSVLTALAFIPTDTSALLVTADRDEHIRISRYPQAWSIVGYLLGHRKFVAALLWLPHPDPAHHGRLLSAGGDDALFVWDYLRGKVLHTVDVSGLAKGMKVWPAKQLWFSKTRTHKRRRTNPSISEPPPQPTGNTPPVENDTESILEEPQSIVQKTCVNKIIHTPASEISGPGYVLITSVGSSTIAYISKPHIFEAPASTDKGTQYIDLDLPILDIVVLEPHLVLVSLDTSFSPSSSKHSFRTLSVSPNKIEEIVDPRDFNLPGFNHASIIENTNEIDTPSQELLYPELLLLSKDTSGEERFLNARSAPSHNSNSVREVGSGGRSGKKLEGRLVCQVRCGILLANNSGGDS